MSIIDRQRIAAVKAMEALGYTFTGIDWKAPATATTAGPNLLDEADAMHALLVLRADKLDGCTEGSEEVTELRMLTEVVTAYEEKRWPDGKLPGGKG